MLSDNLITTKKCNLKPSWRQDEELTAKIKHAGDIVLLDHLLLLLKLITVRRRNPVKGSFVAMNCAEGDTAQTSARCRQ